jgi:putative DNA primase/helicase
MRTIFRVRGAILPVGGIPRVSEHPTLSFRTLGGCAMTGATRPRNGKATKVPYAPKGGKAKADDPLTWGSRTAAEAKPRQIGNGSGGGIGIQLGPLGGDTFLAGIDLDSCLGNDGAPVPWAATILHAVPTYAERSPSGHGIKAFV